MPKGLQGFQKGHKIFKGSEKGWFTTERTLGINNPFYGRKHTEEAKKIIGEKGLGRIPYNKGKHMWANRPHPRGTLGMKQSAETIEKRVSKIRGELNVNWIKDRTYILERHRLHGTLDWKNWRMEVFSRDKYTCQECGDSGVYIEPHHIIPLRSNIGKIFEVTNGITLCRPCHQKTIWKESNFVEKYSALVVAQK